jgi:hypothetical protein
MMVDVGPKSDSRIIATLIVQHADPVARFVL